VVGAQRRPPVPDDPAVHPERVPDIPENLAPLQGAVVISMLSGGLRYATTTGYSLSALRAARFS